MRFESSLLDVSAHPRFKARQRSNKCMMSSAAFAPVTVSSGTAHCSHTHTDTHILMLFFLFARERECGTMDHNMTCTVMSHSLSSPHSFCHYAVCYSRMLYRCGAHIYSVKAPQSRNTWDCWMQFFRGGYKENTFNFLIHSCCPAAPPSFQLASFFVKSIHPCMSRNVCLFLITRWL